MVKHHSGGLSQPWERTTVVAGDEGKRLGGGRDPARATQGEDRSGPVHHGGNDLRLTAQLQHLRDRDEGAVRGGAVSQPVQQILESHRDNHCRRRATGADHISRGEDVIAHLFQRVMVSLPQGAQVHIPVPCPVRAGRRNDTRSDQRLQDGAQLRSEAAVSRNSPV